jgi:hypothetical protein
MSLTPPRFQEEKAKKKIHRYYAKMLCALQSSPAGISNSISFSQIYAATINISSSHTNEVSDNNISTPTYLSSPAKSFKITDFPIESAQNKAF